VNRELLTNMRSVESSVLIKLPPDKVLNAFTNPEELWQWWGVERSLIELKKGGLYALIWEISDQGMGYVTTGIIKEYIPGCQLSIEDMAYCNPGRPILGPLKLLILTTPEKNMTSLTVVQSGYQTGKDWDWYYESVKTAWPAVLTQLRDYLEKTPV
jgi:uncharacterized protein YndB with AHSA1/START domain